nr:hypothetical protein [Kibdelosporangium sp. MJ126-NF4]CEL21790.1 hypothetical protein [Kibdelosporangium sp. MJ126-NF4]CTQ92570.1 hypothetical protein [Kibdelosporangium sp. MJ126-NF4]
MRRVWLGITVLAVFVLPSCGNPPDGGQPVTSTDSHAPAPVAPTTAQSELHKHLVDLKLLVASGPCAPQECVQRAQSILARSVAIRRTILDSPDRGRLRPAVDIVDRLAGISADQAGDPGIQRQIVEVGVELVDWLGRNVTW